MIDYFDLFIKRVLGLPCPLLFFLIGLMVACMPAVAKEARVEDQPYQFYLYEWTGNQGHNRLMGSGLAIPIFGQNFPKTEAGGSWQ